ncbi:MAG: porin family protein [Cyclobacteriaceae bacterium]
MVRNILVGLSLLLACRYSYAQTSTCAQTLRLVRSTYELGRFHEIPGLLEKCLQRGEGNFTKQEKVEALKILTLAYLYSEDPEQADQAMLELLKTDHFFEINENVDPAEFTALYRTFRTKPLFAIGLKFGANASLPVGLRNFYVGAEGGGVGEYSIGYNIQYGASFEKALFTGLKDTIRWTIAPELIFSSHQFSQSNERYTVSDETGESFSRGEYIHSLSRINLNALLQYRFSTSSVVNPYIMAGGAISAVTKAQLQADTQFPEVGSVETGASIDFTDSYNTFDYAAIVGAGVKYKFGEIYLSADVRYQYGLSNVIDGAARFNPEAAMDRGYVPNDHTLSNLVVNIGFVWPYFKPRKLLK